MLRWLWIALAVWGAVHPMYWFMAYLAANEWSLSALIDAWYVNASTTGLVWDLTIAAIALTLWILVETIQRRNWRGLFAIPAIYCIGVSCGLPLYLYLRARKARA
jgi:hypothetical protein